MWTASSGVGLARRVAASALTKKEVKCDALPADRNPPHILEGLHLYATKSERFGSTLHLSGID
jgi:hypothetical protein